jgi:hypothetical protein
MGNGGEQRPVGGNKNSENGITRKEPFQRPLKEVRKQLSEEGNFKNRRG